MSADTAERPRWATFERLSALTRVRVLGHGPEGPNVMAMRASSAASPWLVAKHYSDASGANAATAMQAVGRALATRDRPPLAVPSVLAWHGRRRVLVQSLAPGRPLLPELQSPRRRAAVRAAAQALACLHSLPVRAGRVTSVSDHLAELVRPRPVVLAGKLPALGARVRAVTAALHARPHMTSAERPVAIHRDAHARQMFLDGDRVWLVDWDLYARGDAALDVANFAVYLRTHLPHGGARAAAHFVDDYISVSSDVSERLPLFVALTYVRLVAKNTRQRLPGWQARVREYLDRAERALS